MHVCDQCGEETARPVYLEYVDEDGDCDVIVLCSSCAEEAYEGTDDPDVLVGQ